MGKWDHIPSKGDNGKQRTIHERKLSTRSKTRYSRRQVLKSSLEVVELSTKSVKSKCIDRPKTSSVDSTSTQLNNKVTLVIEVLIEAVQNSQGT